MTLIVDASVGLKWFSDEDDTDRALALLGTSERLIAPDLVVSEICNGAWRLVRVKEMREMQLASIAPALAATFDELFPSMPLAGRALAIARSLDHPVYDCFYLALSELTDAAVVTADERLLRRIKGTAWKSRARPLGTAE
ncbi:MAG: type II toxin-antitoxin system VapC family toxin [Alphaproteobacteria bacterium]|nr:type II toxin-antitoxin system VapC family toxin [Alphaproteobacteria bacterium]